jgi:CheY-like chemotaxis protein
MMRVLIAEDDSDNLYLAQKILTAAGYTVLLARNGEEAVQLALAERPSLVIMDLYMPVLSGFEAICQIRERVGDSLPILALTALAFPDDRERALSIGANGYLSKPYLPGDLRSTVQALTAVQHTNESC